MSSYITSYNNYDTLYLHGSINIGAIPALTPQLSVYFQERSSKDLVIDLTNVITIDSSIIRLFLNIKKRVETNKNHLYLMHPSDDVQSLLTDSNLHKVLTIISDTNELQKTIDKFSYDRFLPFTYEEKGLRRIRCSCGACGSTDVNGYLMAPGTYSWKWRDNDIFPFSEDQTAVFFDYYSVLPIICTDCLMASTDITHFNVIDENNNVHYKSILDDKTKLLLSKSTKKRKKIMESNITFSDTYFVFPRNRLASFQAYLLAESCAKSITINKGGIDSFNIGYMNYLALQFAPDNQKEELTSNCRTWLTQVLSDPTPYSALQLAQTYYILIIVSLSVEKFKDVSKFFSDMSTLIKTVPEQDKSLNAINSPTFWFVKAEQIWNSEIEKKSNALKL
jgi:anti-anti-sigma factor